MSATEPAADDGPRHGLAGLRDSGVLVGSSLVAVLAGLLHPSLGMLVGAAGGTALGGVGTGLAAGAIGLLGATVVRLGVSSVTNPIYLAAAAVGVGIGLWLRRAAPDGD